MNVRSLTRATTLRSAIISGGLLWAVGALALGAVGFLEVEGFWVGVICLLAFGLMLGGALRVAASLLPLTRLGQRLAPVRDGSAARLEGEYPAEVHPLVDEVNDLLRRNQEALRRSHLEADSLAHGLKTPLTILTNEIERLRKDDHPAAEGLREQVEAMSDRVTLHLSRASAAAARLAQPPTGSCPVAPSVDRLVRAMRQLHVGRRLEIRCEVPPDLNFHGNPEDLEEMLGNVLENACKWCRGSVEVRAHAAEDRLLIVVEDDGPGLSEAVRDQILATGQPESAHSRRRGVGLRIVKALVELYGGGLRLDGSAKRGLQVTLELPATGTA